MKYLATFALFAVMIIVMSDLWACTDDDVVNDLSVYCDYRIHKPCMSFGDSINCCLK